MAQMNGNTELYTDRANTKGESQFTELPSATLCVFVLLTRSPCWGCSNSRHSSSLPELWLLSRGVRLPDSVGEGLCSGGDMQLGLDKDP